jgi:hypothetical protein
MPPPLRHRRGMRMHFMSSLRKSSGDLEFQSAGGLRDDEERRQDIHLELDPPARALRFEAILATILPMWPPYNVAQITLP